MLVLSRVFLWLLTQGQILSSTGAAVPMRQALNPTVRGQSGRPPPGKGTFDPLVMHCGCTGIGKLGPASSVSPQCWHQVAVAPGTIPCARPIVVPLSPLTMVIDYATWYLERKFPCRTGALQAAHSKIPISAVLSTVDQWLCVVVPILWALGSCRKKPGEPRKLEEKPATLYNVLDCSPNREPQPLAQ